MKNVRRNDEAAMPLGTAADADAHAGTRNRVARLILNDGPATASDLARRLSLTPAGVRRHLDALLEAGFVEVRQQRVYGSRGRGRPAKVYALTDTGRSVFYQAYDALAIEALDFLTSVGGPHAVEAFAQRRIAGFEERHRAEIGAATPEDRVRRLAEVLTSEGYAAGSRDVRNATVPGAQLCQHHCPVAHVAARFPQLCEAETAAFSRLLDTHVQRLATIAHGDGVCTTFVPNGDAPDNEAVSDMAPPRPKNQTTRAPGAPGGNPA